MSQWDLQPVFGSIWIVVLTIAILVALLVLTPSFNNVSKKQWLSLVGIRAAVILLLAISLLRPTMISTEKKNQPTSLIVMFDLSKSMTVPDAEGGITRWEAQLNALRRMQKDLDSLNDNINVYVYGFDEKATLISAQDGVLNFPEQPTGQQTDIGSSIDDVLQELAGKRIAGLILLSDGAQRVYSPRIELQQAARDLARLGSPLHTVTFGKAIDPSQARDLSVETLNDHYTVFVQNEAVIRSVIDIRGFANKEVPVQLIIEDELGNSTVVETKQMKTTENQEQIDVEFSYTPTQPGQYKLTVNIPVQEGELVTKNNVLNSYLNVLIGGLKILYIEGRVVDRPEQKFLRRAINLSADMKIDFQWFDKRGRGDWPKEELADTIRDGKYDVFILGDIDSKVFNEATLELLAKEVEDGKSLMMLGGFHSFGPGGYYHTPLNNVLPIAMDRFERQDFDTPIRDDLHLKGPLQIQPSGQHYLTHLGPASDQIEIWNSMPKLPGMNRFQSAKPRSLTLLASANNEPILVAGEYGLGRTLAFAGDSTWHWVLAGKGEEHKRFWRQCILWLARKDQLEKQDVWVDLNQRRFHPAAKVSFTAGVKDAAGDAISDASYKAYLVAPDGTRQAIPYSPFEDGMLGQFDAGILTGDYTIEVETFRNEKTIGVGKGKFFVFEQDLELADPSAKPSQMAGLAAITKESGGRTWASEELPELIQQIQNQPPETEVEVQTRWTWPESTRDAWLNALLLATLLGSEWYLRKRWQMV
ncbi:MAG: glutamine amidotransferase [Pirellulales bacterium]